MSFRLFLCSIILTIQVFSQPKNIFFFIGDGMGIGHRSIAEIMMNAMDTDKPGVKMLNMNRFPVQSLCYTHSADSYITDSAAAGTALASGKKTYDGAIGVDMGKKPVTPSLAELAKQKNRKVGIVTSAPIDHATPAVFYAHVESRKMTYDISVQLAQSDMDYFGGGCSHGSNPKYLKGRKSPLEIAKENGYTLIQSNKDFFTTIFANKKILAMDENALSGCDLPFSIDAKPGQLRLKDYVIKGIEALENKNGFFFMIEGGKIDWAAHSNDAATVAREVMDLDEAISVAYQFYQKNPQNTLVLVTADHETGGLSLGRTETKYKQYPKVLTRQNISMDAFNQIVLKWKEEKADWFKVIEKIESLFGLDKLSTEEYETLRNAYLLTINPELKKRKKMKELMYSRSEPISIAIIEMISKRAGIGWTTTAHTGNPVPVSVVGSGQEKFIGMLDNITLQTKLKELVEEE